MKIGIISDSHTQYLMTKNALNMLINNGAEFIVHAGDIVQKETLDLLKDCGIKYVAVYGNNDAHLTEFHQDYYLVKEPYYFKMQEIKFKIMHLPLYMSPDSDIVIFGHTHQFISEFKNGTLYLNPGELCAREKPISECAMLDISFYSFDVTHYFKDIEATEFQEKHFSYVREGK